MCNPHRGQWRAVSSSFYNWTTCHHVHASSPSLLLLIFKKKDTFFKRGHRSPTHCAPDGQVCSPPHPALPLGREAKPVCQAVSCGTGFSPDRSHPPPPCFVLFLLWFPALLSPAPGARAASVSISFTTQDHLCVPVPFISARAPSARL